MRPLVIRKWFDNVCIIHRDDLSDHLPRDWELGGVNWFALALNERVWLRNPILSVVQEPPPVGGKVRGSVLGLEDVKIELYPGTLGYGIRKNVYSLDLDRLPKYVDTNSDNHQSSQHS